MDKTVRLTNECWLGCLSEGEPVYVCGHKFLLRLEGTALEIWKLIDGQNTMADIIAKLTSSYQAVRPESIAEGTIEYILQLERFGLAAWRSRPLFEDVPLDE